MLVISQYIVCGRYNESLWFGVCSSRNSISFCDRDGINLVIEIVGIWGISNQLNVDWWKFISISNIPSFDHCLWSLQSELILESFRHEVTWLNQFEIQKNLAWFGIHLYIPWEQFSTLKIVKKHYNCSLLDNHDSNASKLIS